MSLGKLDNRFTMIELGKSKVATRIVHSNNDEFPIGMFINDINDQENKDGVIITLQDMSAYASYFMSALRVLEARVQHKRYTDVYEDKLLNVMKEVLSMKKLFEPFLPKGYTKNNPMRRFYFGQIN